MLSSFCYKESYTLNQSSMDIDILHTVVCYGLFHPLFALFNAQKYINKPRAEKYLD